MSRTDARLAAALLVVLAAAPAPAQDASPPAAPAVRAAFTGGPDDLAARHPGIVRVTTFGRSAGGRPLRLVTISASAESEVTWAALVVARLSGDTSPDATRIALDAAARLAEDAAALPPGVAFRFVAEASPDASAAAMRAGNDTPTDDDRDGARDEDAPDDLDGDGVAGWMRVPDAAGAFAADDPAKPGAAPERADAGAGRRPAWTIVREGRDDDGDRSFNEDGPGGADVSRNFAWGFEEHTPSAGRWAVSEPESRALMDVLLADERIALVYELGAAETISALPGWGGAWPQLPDPDVRTIEALRGLHADGALPKDRRRAHAPGAGSLGAVVWHQLGRIWLGRAPVGRSGPSWPAAGSSPPAGTFEWVPATAAGAPDGAQVLHLGAPDAANAPPSWERETESVASFLAAAAAARAKPEFVKTETSGDAGALRIETRIANTGRLPTHAQRGADVKGRRPINVRVDLPAGATLVAGRPLVQIERIGAGEESDVLRWVVSGASGAAVRVVCTGPDTGAVTLEVRIP